MILTYDQDIKLAGPADIAAENVRRKLSADHSGARGDFAKQPRQSGDGDLATGQFRPVLERNRSDTTDGAAAAHLMAANGKVVC